MTALIIIGWIGLLVLAGYVITKVLAFLAVSTAFGSKITLLHKIILLTLVLASALPVVLLFPFKINIGVASWL